MATKEANGKANETDLDNSDDPLNEKKITFRNNKFIFMKKIFKSILIFIWDNQNKAFLSRSFLSWTYLGIMYTIFYILSGAFFWAMVAIFMGILQSGYSTRPKYTGLDTAFNYIEFKPGMGVRPHLGTGSARIEYSLKDPSQYLDNLNLFLQDFSDRLPNTIDCSSLKNQTKLDNTACKYDIFTYLNELGCSNESSYGYSNATPCVLVKLNNLFDWSPGSVVYPPEKVLNLNGCNSTEKLDVIKSLNGSNIFVTCSEKTDNKNIKSIQLNSPFGIDNCLATIPFYYYPYNNQPNYMQPLVAVKLSVTPNVDVTVTCSAYASGTSKSTSVDFTIRINV